MVRGHYLANYAMVYCICHEMNFASQKLGSFAVGEVNEQTHEKKKHIHTEAKSIHKRKCHYTTVKMVC